MKCVCSKCGQVIPPHYCYRCNTMVQPDDKHTDEDCQRMQDIHAMFVKRLSEPESVKVI